MPMDQQSKVSAANDGAVVPDIVQKAADRPSGVGLNFAKKFKCNRPGISVPNGHAFAFSPAVVPQLPTQAKNFNQQ